MSLFLTPEDLCELTGYRRQAAQIRWLREHGYRFDVRADGRPVVLRAEIDAKLCSAQQKARRHGPDFAALRKAG